ncbi:glutamine--tRNA ligase/YqeY domain fusion protein [Neptuniibacter sp. CAU 1671]|uniref:glutamine--tRNA ligase/YqeY domain fusion protein n=1 Tax=Neptuniibacter sp. CAU 1671 TaxID=3032593 RepID=UPI0023DC3B34|nr:glutamine--tRNA ligase/YqeY domain fusion protein [Neptuniibacter sp. CAU 1671]MDF2180786.1 glutamine--tRNA ligase/YqeY domain fusion protein [Neptuniibacter sp. CAU 1671]
MSTAESSKPVNFIHQIVEKDLQQGTHDGRVVTRFPPEPNGYLHIGHAKSICLNFGTAEKYQGACNLRFDDTNPEKESQEYIDSIIRDVNWLGYQWQGEVRYTSDYFQQLHDWAVYLIEQGKAYVCDLSPEQAKEYRGNFTTPGRNSPFRDRSVEENLALFARMKNGEFAEGSCSLRAKIDMQSPNMNLRDPMIYRIMHTRHHQTGDQWCIYPMYDFAHGQSDAIEGVTHSICTLEFEDHRPLYEWFIENLPVPCAPKQYEFSRLELNYTITSKRRLKQLVDEAHVAGWDDPRMPTISGLRRRGYTPAALREFCDRVGVTRSNGVVDMGMLEAAIRDDLDKTAPRAMCVVRPIKVTLTNYPADQQEWFELPNHPKDETMGQRQVPFSANLLIEEEDFAEEPPRKWKRLAPGEAVRLRGAYVITCNEVIKDAEGNVVELKCSYDPDTKGSNPEGYKPNGVIHWVCAQHSVPCEVREYDRLFTVENPAGDKERDFLECINPDSLVVLNNSRCEIGLQGAAVESRFQFERTGYFAVDADSTAEKLVFNRTVTLRDSWK